MANTFKTFCETIQQMGKMRETHEKIRHCVRYFRSLAMDRDLHLAAQFIGEGAFEAVSGKRASVGSRTSGLAAAKFCEIDYDLVFKPCRTATGSNSETVARLMANIPAAVQKREPAGLTLDQVQHRFERLHRASGRAEKEEILWNTWTQMTPVEIKYFIRMLSRGSLRLGFDTRSVAAAIAEAFGPDPEEVRYVHMMTGSIGKTAVLARNDQLEKTVFRLFHPVSFMLASPMESRSVERIEDYLAEEKFDGMRAQVHASGPYIKIFSRDLNDVTRSFPEIRDFFAGRNLPPAVFDGEICVFKENTIFPFQLLQKRIGVKKPGKKLLKTLPVLFISFDLLYVEETPVFDLPLTKRRSRLKQMASEYRLPVASQYTLSAFSDVDDLFRRAIDHGNEGLVLKQKASTYEYGERRKSWLKVKKPGGSLDTVVMYAHSGSGKRGGTYSDFTLGISVRNDVRYEEEFIPIGKVYGGYTDEELEVLNRKVGELAVERYGPTVGLIPELVVEVEFDDILKNKRTKAGYSLRLPRFRAIRRDLGTDDVDTLRDVERYYQIKIEQKPLSQNQYPSFRFPGDSWQ